MSVERGYQARFWIMLAVQALTVATAWGALQANVSRVKQDVAEIKEIIGDGHPGSFLRLREAEQILNRLDRIEAKLDRLRR